MGILGNSGPFDFYCKEQDSEVGDENLRPRNRQGDQWVAVAVWPLEVAAE